MLGQCQTYITDEPYPLSASSGSSLDTLAVDSSLGLAGSAYPDFFGYPTGLPNDPSFANDVASGSISFDSNNSIYTPPLSPEEDGPNVSMVLGEGGLNAEYSTLDIGLSQMSGFQQDPPSPPMSDRDVYLCSRPNQFSDYQSPRGTMIMQSRHNSSTSSSSGSASRTTSSAVRGNGYITRPVQRTLKPAPQRSREYNQEIQHVSSTGQAKSKEKPNTAQPRSHPLYRASPGKDGFFTCPFSHETRCSHPPTKQKCGYE